MYFIMVNLLKDKLHSSTDPPSGTNAANVNQIWNRYYPAASGGLYISVLVSAKETSQPMMLCPSEHVYNNNSHTIQAWDDYVTSVKSAMDGYQACDYDTLNLISQKDRQYAGSTLMTPYSASDPLSSCQKALVNIYCPWVSEPGSTQAKDIAETIQDVSSPTLNTEAVSGVLIPDSNLPNIQNIGLIVAFLILAFMLGNFRLVLLTLGMYFGSIGGASFIMYFIALQTDVGLLRPTHCAVA